MKKKIKIAFSVDDVCPKVGYGLLMDNGPLKYLSKLHDEFGCKFTLFTIPKKEDNPTFSLDNNTSWVEKMTTAGYYELAAHGLTHMPKNPQYGGQEFLELSDEEVYQRIVESKQMFKSVGIDVQGWKSPGWTQPPEIYNMLEREGFLYIGDHFIGREPIKQRNLYRLPYTFTINQIYHGQAEDGDIIVLHSHINSEGGIVLNAWNEKLYEIVRNYLLVMERDYDVEYIFMKDIIEN